MPVHARISAYYFAYFAFVGAFSPYFGLYLHEHGFSAWEIGLLMSQMQLMRLLGPYFWGSLADKKNWQRTHIIRLGGLLSLCGFTAFFWLDQLLTMLLAMAVLAFFWSGALPLVETLTFDHLRERASRYGAIRMWGSIGFIVMVLATGRILDSLSVDSVLWACWLALFGIFALALWLPDIPRRCHPQEAPPVRQILAQPRVRALFLSCMAMSAAHGVLYVFYSLHLAAHGYSKSTTGLLWSLGVVAEILIFMFMPKIMARWGLKQVLLVCYVVAAVRFVLIGWTVDWLLLALFAQILHGLTFGAHHAASIAAVNRWFPGSSQARGQALYSSLSFGAGSLLGNLLSGYLWDHIGGAWAFSCSALFALFGAWLVWRWLDEDTEPLQSATSR